MSFFEPYKNGCLIKIKLTPNAAKNTFGAGIFTDSNGADYLKASVTSAPEKGKANKELLKMLAKSLGVSVSKCEVVKGQTEHLKKIFIDFPLTLEFEQKISSLKKEK